MKVKICPVCPYTPADIAHNYDAASDTYVCGRCPRQGLLCYAQGPYYRDRVIHPERTNYVKRNGGTHVHDTVL